MNIKVEKMGSIHQLTITDSQGFMSRELLSNDEASELIRKLIISRYATRQEGSHYTGAFINGYINDIAGTPEEEAAKIEEEKAFDVWIAKQKAEEKKR